MKKNLFFWVFILPALVAFIDSLIFVGWISSVIYFGFCVFYCIRSKLILMPIYFSAALSSLIFTFFLGSFINEKIQSDIQYIAALKTDATPKNMEELQRNKEISFTTKYRLLGYINNDQGDRFIVARYFPYKYIRHNFTKKITKIEYPD